MKDGQQYPARNVAVARDCTFFTASIDTTRMGVTTLDIARIKIIERERHGGKGALLGAITGATAGYLIGRNDCDDNSGLCLNFASGPVTALGIGVIGATLGFTVGEAMGREIVYEFP